jgi:hypothetical protein
MQGIYNYIPKTNHVSRVYNVAAILCLQYMVHTMLFPMTNVLYFYISILPSSPVCAVPNMSVICSSLLSSCPGILIRYFLHYFEMAPVDNIITGITFGFIFHVFCISIVRSFYFKIFSASFLITFLSPQIPMSIDRHIRFSLSRIMMFGLLFAIVLSVFTC